MAHVHHLSPTAVVAVRRVRVLVVVRGLDVKLRIIGVMNVEFNLTLQGGHVLSVHLVSEMPENTLPNESRLAVFQSNVVFIVGAL